MVHELDTKTGAGSWLGEDVLSIEQFGVESAKYAALPQSCGHRP